MKQNLRIGLFSLLAALPATAAAQRFVTIYGSTMTITQILGTVVSVGATWIGGLAGTTFLVGALWLVAGAGKEDQVGNAKKIMIGSLMGLGLVLLSYAIIRLVFFVIY